MLSRLTVLPRKGATPPVETTSRVWTWESSRINPSVSPLAR
jgi:hypothetical protein